METVFKLWVEWEVGQEDVVFSSEDKAWEWLAERLTHVDIEETVEELLEAGLCGIQELQVI